MWKNDCNKYFLCQNLCHFVHSRTNVKSMVLTGPCLEYLLKYLAIQKQNYNIFLYTNFQISNTFSNLTVYSLSKSAQYKTEIVVHLHLADAFIQSDVQGREQSS